MLGSAAELSLQALGYGRGYSRFRLLTAKVVGWSPTRGAKYVRGSKALTPCFVLRVATLGATSDGFLWRISVRPQANEIAGALDGPTQRAQPL